MDNPSMATQAHPLTPEQNERLDQLLAQWRQRHGLATEVAAQVRHDALAATASLPDEWWATFEERMSWLFTAVNQLPLWGSDTRGVEGQTRHAQWKFTRYQQNYWRPATL